MSNAVSQATRPTNDFFDTTASWFSEKPFAVAKAGQVLIDVLEKADLIPEGHDEGFASAKHHITLIKLARAPGEFLKKNNALRHAVADCLESPSFANGAKVLRKGVESVSPIWDGVDFLTKAVVHIPKNAPWVKNLKGVNSGALVFGMTWSACENLTDIYNNNLYGEIDPAKRSEKFTKVGSALINLVKNVSYFVLGILGVRTIFFGLAAAPVLLTALSAVTVVFSIMDFYHKNWGAERKGEF